MFSKILKQHILKQNNLNNEIIARALNSADKKNCEEKPEEFIELMIQELDKGENQDIDLLKGEQK